MKKLLLVSQTPFSAFQCDLSATFDLTICSNILTAQGIAYALKPLAILIEPNGSEWDALKLAQTFASYSSLASARLILLLQSQPSPEFQEIARHAGIALISTQEAVCEAISDRILSLTQSIQSQSQTSSYFSTDIPPSVSIDQETLWEQNELLRTALREHQEKLHQLELHIRHAQRLSSIGTISSGVAHDFNNILCGILCLAEVGLRAAKDSPDCHRNFHDIRTASNRASNLVRAILSFSKRQEQPRGPIYPSEALVEGLVMLRATIPSFVEIAETILAPTATILGEISQFQQVLTNLVLNARHAIGNKSGRIDVRIDLCPPNDDHRQRHPSLQAKPYVCLQVIDNGSGIATEHLAHLCDPFFTTKPAGQGTGLGLWVTRGIVESWDGVMVIDTKLGEGTSFSIYFPLAPASAAPTPNPALTTIPHEKKILISDDDSVLATQS